MQVTVVLNSPQVDTARLKALALKTVVVAVDGGLVHLDRMGIVPDWLVGDMDSAGKLADKYTPKAELLRYPRDKDYTDLELALAWLEDKRLRQLHVLGLTGGRRLDHQLTNWARLGRFAAGGCRVQVYTPDQNMTFTTKSQVLVPAAGRCFSLAAVNGPAIVNLKGCRFGGTNITLVPGTGLGLGNSIDSARALVHICQGTVCIFQWQED